MNKHVLWLGIAAAVVIFAASAPAALADDCELEDHEIFFELNNTDEDLGIHGLIDGEPWKRMRILYPKWCKRCVQFDLRLSRRLRQQGMTELFFESDEPEFDELDPEDFFRRFPEGDYRILATLKGGRIVKCAAEVSHNMPAPPEIDVNGTEPVECDEALPKVEEGAGFVVSWGEVDDCHSELGNTGPDCEDFEVDLYEVVVEREEPELEFKVLVPSDVTEVTLPTGLFEDGDEVKVEVLVREDTGNQTATEGCFEADVD